MVDKHIISALIFSFHYIFTCNWPPIVSYTFVSLRNYLRESTSFIFLLSSNGFWAHTVLLYLLILLTIIIGVWFYRKQEAFDPKLIAKQSNNSGRRSVKRHSLRNCVAKSNHKLSTRCSSSYLPSLLSNISTLVLSWCNSRVLTTLQ